MNRNQLKLGGYAIILNVMTVAATRYLLVPSQYSATMYKVMLAFLAALDLVTACGLLYFKLRAAAAAFLVCGLILLWMIAGV